MDTMNHGYPNPCERWRNNPLLTCPCRLAFRFSADCTVQSDLHEHSIFCLGENSDVMLSQFHCFHFMCPVFLYVMAPGKSLKTTHSASCTLVGSSSGFNAVYLMVHDFAGFLFSNRKFNVNPTATLPPAPPPSLHPYMCE